jgi:hypothetical protein
VEVLVIIGIYRRAGWQCAIVDKVCQQQDAVEPLAGIDTTANAPAHGGVPERVRDLCSDGWRHDQREGLATQEKAEELAGWSLGPNRGADKHVRVKYSANHELLPWSL